MPPTRDTTHENDLTGQAYRSVRRIIETGGMTPGTKLSHRTLSRDLKIGRSPVRDALLRLEAEGLIEHRPGSGIYLREITKSELEHVYDIRIVNEPHFAGEAARHATPKHLAALRRTCEQMAVFAGKPNRAQWYANRENLRRVCRLDVEFHKTVLDASGNPIAARLFSNPQILALSFAWDLFFMKPEWSAEVAEQSYSGHRAVFEAISRRDAAAASQNMRDHLVWGRREVPRHYASLQEKTPSAKAAVRTTNSG